jgi:hypothetical protein
MKPMHRWAFVAMRRLMANAGDGKERSRSWRSEGNGKRNRTTSQLVLSLMSLSLSGCAVMHTVMIDEKGRQEVAAASGWGVVGAPTAAVLHSAAVKKLRDHGFVTLSEFEAKEGPKVEERKEITPAPDDGPPVWKAGDSWTYQVTGISTGQYREEIVGEETIAGLNAYVMRCSEDSALYVDRSLNIIQRRKHDEVEYTYLTPRKDYDWPLTVGKSWHARGKMKTGSSENKYARQVVVKGYGIVRVPAGEFEAYYILTTAAPYVGPSIGQERRLLEVWYAPKIRHHVKRVVYTERGRITLELTDHSVGGTLGFRNQNNFEETHPQYAKHERNEP